MPLPVTGESLYLVLDEGDGIFHLDSHEVEVTKTWLDADDIESCPDCYAVGDTEYDDGLVGPFSILDWDPFIYDLDHSGEITKKEMSLALMDFLAKGLRFDRMIQVLGLYLAS